MLTLALIVLLALGAFAGLRVLLGPRQLSVRQFFVVYAAVVFGGSLVWLGLTGRLHWLFALIGAGLPWLGRLWTLFVTSRRALGMLGKLRGAAAAASGAAQEGARPGSTSEITTQWVRMVLQHDSGEIDGEVIAGRYTGSQLSELNRDEVFQLLQEVSEDDDTLQVLYAYLDRMHDGWRDEAGTTGETEGRNSGTGGALSPHEALEILGLTAAATDEDIIRAHKSLIQKLHPDRGGSTFLAARVNEAKDLLLKR